MESYTVRKKNEGIFLLTWQVFTDMELTRTRSKLLCNIRKISLHREIKCIVKIEGHKEE